MAAEVPQTLEYRGGQLNTAPILEVENFINWKKRKPEGQWTTNERKAANLDQRLKSLIMSVLPDDQMNSVINSLTAKSTWDDLILYHEGPSDVKENSPNDEEDTRNSQEYLNALEEEYQARALLAKSKRFFKKGTQRFSSAKATDQIECHKCGKKGHFARDCWSKTSIPLYQSPFHPKPLSSSQHQPELRPTKDFKAKYNKVKAKLALISSSTSASKASMVKNKGLIAEAYEWDKEEVSSDDNEMVEVKVLMAPAEDNEVVNKEGAKNGEWVKIFMRKALLSEAEGFILPNHDTKRILLTESQRNTIDPQVTVTDSSATDYDSVDESAVCSTPLPPLKKLDGVEPVFGPSATDYDLVDESSASRLQSELLNFVSVPSTNGILWDCQGGLAVHGVGFEGIVMGFCLLEQGSRKSDR
ncbi:retrovirus-related pol polyprotein from transposon TNT 1-94 [Tanacetum coccineum]